MKQLDYLNLVTDFDGSTIKIRTTLVPANNDMKTAHFRHMLILDTGADTTALTREFLTKSGYVKYNKSGMRKRTAAGEVELLNCEINGVTIANQFKIVLLSAQRVPELAKLFA